MTIIEALVRLRDDIKLWASNNLRLKADMDYVNKEIDKTKTYAANNDAVVLLEAQKGIDAVQNSLDTHKHTKSEITDFPTTETWTFILEDGSIVTKAVYVG